jgi:hypothetical protein
MSSYQAFLKELEIVIFHTVVPRNTTTIGNCWE